jgi:hypothetical protein
MTREENPFVCLSGAADIVGRCLKFERCAYSEGEPKESRLVWLDLGREVGYLRKVRSKMLANAITGI